jgi:hypothetical protein
LIVALSDRHVRAQDPDVRPVVRNVGEIDLEVLHRMQARWYANAASSEDLSKFAIFGIEQGEVNTQWPMISRRLEAVS